VIKPSFLLSFFPLTQLLPLSLPPQSSAPGSGPPKESGQAPPKPVASSSNASSKVTTDPPVSSLSATQRTKSHSVIANIPEIGVSSSSPPPPPAVEREQLTNSAPPRRSYTTSNAPSLNVLRKSVLNASEENVVDPNPDKDVHINIVDAQHQAGEEDATNHEAEGGGVHENSSGSSTSLKQGDDAPSNCDPTN